VHGQHRLPIAQLGHCLRQRPRSHQLPHAHALGAVVEQHLAIDVHLRRQGGQWRVTDEGTCFLFAVVAVIAVLREHGQGQRQQQEEDEGPT
jgi:hypothetical protein